MNLTIFTGCGGAEEESPTEIAAEPDATEVEETPVMEETVVPTATPLPTNTPTPTATPLPPEIVVVDDAPVYVEDELLIDFVSMPEDGWVAVWPDSANQLDAEDVLAFIEVDSGQLEGVTFELNGENLNANRLQVALHGGRQSGAEFAENVDNIVLIQTILVDTPASRPMIETESTLVSDTGFLQVDKVQLDGPGWIAAYSVDGQDLLGFAAVPAGGGTNLSVPIQWRRATSQIQLHLLHDLGGEGDFESDIDEAAMFQGEPVQHNLSIGLPAEMVVFDQPMDASIFLHRVTSPQDGYAVAFTDNNEDGFPDLILGAVPIEKGSNEFLEIQIEEGSASNQVVMSLYYDSNNSGEFDYPEDEPIMLGTEELSQLLLPVRSDVEGLLMVNSSPTSAGVEVMLVATPLDAWLIVEAAPDDEGVREVLGQQKIPAGIFHDLQVPIDGASVGDQIRIMVYINNPDPDLFEPERNDFPLLADQRQLFVELVVIE
ncbi:MAG: hypothetical protein AAGD96_05955 [Chloroflexota bacterium]